MYTVEQIVNFAKRGLLELPPWPRYRLGHSYIPKQESTVVTGPFESFEDSETGEILYRRKST